MIENNENNLRKPIEIIEENNVPYIYYDMLNVVAGASEVVLEFGNSVRNSGGNSMRLSHRAVLSVPAAFKLQQGLSQTLQMLQAKLHELQQEALKKQNAGKSGDNA